MKKASYIFLFIFIIIATLLGFKVPILAYAYTYNDHYIDFTTKEVTDFSNFDIVLNKDTYNMNAYGNAFFGFQYKASSCPTNTFSINLSAFMYYNGVSQGRILNDNIYLTCSTSYNQYSYNNDYTLTAAQKALIKQVLAEDNDNNIRLLLYYTHYNTMDPLFQGVTFNFRDMEFGQSIYYEFNTTYYFTHLLLDVNANYLSSASFVLNSDGTEDARARLLVAYDNSIYNRWWNDDPINSTTRGRKKYAVDDNGERITAYGIGVGTETNSPYDAGYYIKSSSASAQIQFSTTIYTLNYASSQATFPGASTSANWNYTTCDAWDIPCHLGNALVYMAKDMPLTSDIFSIGEAGYNFIGNSLYAFSTMLGVDITSEGVIISGSWIAILIATALGFMIVKWLMDL